MAFQLDNDDPLLETHVGPTKIPAGKTSAQVLEVHEVNAINGAFDLVRAGHKAHEVTLAGHATSLAGLGKKTSDRIVIESNGSDDTTAIHDAFAAAMTSRRQIVLAGPEFYVGPLALTGAKGLRIRGLAGTQTLDGAGTILRWIGDSSSPALLLDGCRDCVFSDFTIATRPGGSNLAAVARVQNSASAISSHNSFRRVTAQGLWGDAHIIDGFQVFPGAQNVSNDLHSFEDVHVFWYEGKGFHVTGPQSVLHRFLRSGASSYGYAGTMMRTEGGANFHMYGGTSGGNLREFHLDSSVVGHVIENFHSEGAEQFLLTADEPYDASPMVIRGGTFNTSAMVGTFDHKIIDCRRRALTIENWGVQGSNKPIKVHFDSGVYQPNLFHVRSSFIIGETATEEAVFSGQRPTVAEGLHLYGSGGTQLFVPNRNTISAPAADPNAAGWGSISGTAVHFTVVFDTPEPDTNYRVVGSPWSADGSAIPATARMLYYSTRRTDGFDFIVETAPGVGNTVYFRWERIRL